MFTENFTDFASPGDTITTRIKELTFTATLIEDTDYKDEDYQWIDCDRFKPGWWIGVMEISCSVGEVAYTLETLSGLEINLTEKGPHDSPNHYLRWDANSILDASKQKLKDILTSEIEDCSKALESLA